MARLVADRVAERLVTRALAFAIAVAAGAAGCGEDCQTACARIYDQAQCGVQIPGQQTQDAQRDCVAGCRQALTRPGDMAGYNPFEPVPPLSDWEDYNFRDDGNEKQVATWMDCVMGTDCEQLQLSEGICWPIN